MKIEFLSHVKLDGEYNPVGSIADVDDKVAKGLVKAGHAVKAGSKKGEPKLTDINGIGDEIAGGLEQIGVNTVAALAGVDADSVADLPGVSKNDAKKFIKAAKKLIG